MKRVSAPAVLLFLVVGFSACANRAGGETAMAPADFVALADCPITVPKPYLASEPYLPSPPATYKAAWYGTDDLWTMLSIDGERWKGLPWDGDSFTQKTWWLSRDFVIREEYQPAISVSGRRLDAPGSFSAGDPGTHGFTDFGDAMLVGIDVPSAGCWEIRAEYKGAELAYTVLVE